MRPSHAFILSIALAATLPLAGCKGSDAPEGSTPAASTNASAKIDPEVAQRLVKGILSERAPLEQAYRTAWDNVNSTAAFSFEGDPTREAFDSRVGAADEAARATEELLTFVNEVNDRIREELVERGADEKSADQFMAAFAKSTEASADLLRQMLTLDLDTAKRAQVMLKLLGEHFGKWSVDPNTRMVVAGEGCPPEVPAAFESFWKQFAEYMKARQALEGEAQRMSAEAGIHPAAGS